MNDYDNDDELVDKAAGFMDSFYEEGDSVAKSDDTSLDPTQYHSADHPTLSSKSMSQVVPNALRGLSGVIVPKAKPNGGSCGHDPHKVGIVTVDPYSSHEMKVDLSKIAEDEVKHIMKHVNQDNYRSAALVTFKAVSDKINRRVKASKASPIQISQPVHIESIQETEEPMPAPLASNFEKAPAANTTATSSALPAPLPECKVTFEIPGFGTFETAYHHVICGEDGISLVLVFDTRLAFGMKYFPPKSDNSMYVDIHDQPNVMLVHSGGIQFKLGHYEICVLFIEKSSPKD